METFWVRAHNAQLKGRASTKAPVTRPLVHAGQLMTAAVDLRTACRSALAEALTDDPKILAAINELSTSLF